MDGLTGARCARQRLFHRLWRGQTGGVLRHAAAPTLAGRVEAVLAHELGHFKHRHIVRRMVLLFALSLAGFALLGWLMLQPWFYSGLGVRPSLSLLVSYMPGTPNDALALILFLLVVPVFTVFLGDAVCRSVAPR